MRQVLGVLILLLVFQVLPASAQTSCTANCSKARNAPFNVQADWAPDTTNPDAADGFRLYQSKDGAAFSVVSQLAGAATATTLTFAFGTGLATAGVYTFYIGSFNAVGEGTTAQLPLTILNGKPAGGKGIRITQALLKPFETLGAVTRGLR